MKMTKLHFEGTEYEIRPRYFYLETFRRDCRSACREGPPILSNFVAVDLCFPSRALYLRETLKAIRHSALRALRNKQAQESGEETRRLVA